MDDHKLDAVRKPGQLVAYAGVKPGEAIGEFLPGGGYHTRLLSDVVGPHGRVYALETTRWGGFPGQRYCTRPISSFSSSASPQADAAELPAIASDRAAIGVGVTCIDGLGKSLLEIAKPSSAPIS